MIKAQNLIAWPIAFIRADFPSDIRSSTNALLLELNRIQHTLIVR